MPYIIDKKSEDVKVDPYGTKSLEYTVQPSFPELWLAAFFLHNSYFKIYQRILDKLSVLYPLPILTYREGLL